MLIFLILNSLVLFSAIRIVRSFFNLESLYDFILAVVLFFLAQIVITCQIIGLLNILDVNKLILLNIAIAILVWFVTRDISYKQTLKSDKGFLELFLDNKIVIFAAAAIVGFGLVKIFINLINPPFGWDCLNYHFTFPVEWLKHKNLILPPTICDDPTPTYYPINGSIFYFWLIAPFRDVFLADLGQVPFLLLSFFTILSLSRKLKISQELSFYAAALFLIMPNVFKNIEIAYSDMIMSGLFLAALNFLYLLSKEVKIKNIILSGISLGLLLGIKSAALLYVALLVIFSLYILSKNIKHTGFPKLIFYIFLLAVFIIYLGGFGYLRNFFLTGNPLYPFKVSVFGKTIFNGPMPRVTYQAHWSKEDFNLVKLLFSEGFGPQLFLLILPGIFLTLLLAIKKGLKLFSFFEKFIFILPIILYLIFRYGIPQLWTRFLYPFMAVGLVVSVYGLIKLNVSLRIIRIAIFIFFLASIAELSGHLELIISLLLSIIVFFLLPKIIRLLVSERKVFVYTTIAVFLLAVISFKLIQLNYQRNEFKRYVTNTAYGKELTEAWKWLNDNTQGNNIAYTGRPLPFPLYGSRFKNNVFYVSINNIEPAWLHRFPEANLLWDVKYKNLHAKLSEEGNYRGNADILVWKKNLSKRAIDYLVIYPLHQTDVFPIEDKWAKSEPKNFSLVFSNKEAHIYKLNF